MLCPVGVTPTLARVQLVSKEEIACFAGAIAGLDKGWGAGMEMLAEVLAELKG